jgi:inositol 1,4,5-triphosphate receptor type 1
MIIQDNFDDVRGINELKSNASKLILAVNESRKNVDFLNKIVDKEIFERLVRTSAVAYFYKSSKEVGHNIFILCYQLMKHNEEFKASLERMKAINTSVRESLNFYQKHTAQIEVVRSDRALEQIVFPIPEVCEMLTSEMKMKILDSCEKDERDSKVRKIKMRFLWGLYKN